MLTLEDTQKPDAVEKIFCEPFEKLKMHPMSKDVSEILVKLLLYKGAFKELPDKEKPFLYQVIEKRIKYCFTFNIEDPRLILFLAIVAESPGTAVMYMAYIQYWCKKNGVEVLDLDTFCEKIFPWGFPNEDDLHKLWDEQKVNRKGTHGSDNLLDYETAYKSIQITKVEA